MDQDELQELWIPEIGMSFGACVSALTQSWAGFKLNRERGEHGRVQYYANTINRIQKALGLRNHRISTLARIEH